MRKNSKPKKRKQNRNKKMGGGSIMVPKEREEFVTGGPAAARLIQKLFLKNADDMAENVDTEVTKIFKETERLREEGLKGKDLDKITLSNLYGSVADAPITPNEVAQIRKDEAYRRGGGSGGTKGKLEMSPSEVEQGIADGSLVKIKGKWVKKPEGSPIADAIKEARQTWRALTTPPTYGQRIKEEGFGGLPVDRASRQKAGKFFGIGVGTGAIGSLPVGTSIGGFAVYQYMKNSGLNPDEATPEEVAKVEQEINVSDNPDFIPYGAAFSSAVKRGDKEFTWVNKQGKEETHEVAIATDDPDIVLTPMSTSREKRVHGGIEFSKSVEEQNRKTDAESIARMKAAIDADRNPEVSPELEAQILQERKEQIMDEKIDEALERHKNRKLFVEGGMADEEPMAMPPEMMEEPTEDVPVDTYANATPEEIEAAQEPDEVMEEDYIEFVLNEALVPEEQQYLMNTLEGDPQLSQIFDKVVETASEFSGAGEVTGPGDGISDSIPARLSDGEFVFTKKATDQLGADNLQTMMDDAERAYDGGMMRENRYLGGIMQGDEEELGQGDSTDDDIRKLMSVKANKTPSLR
jgi:hypothetical protein